MIKSAVSMKYQKLNKNTNMSEQIINKIYKFFFFCTIIHTITFIKLYLLFRFFIKWSINLFHK